MPMYKAAHLVSNADEELIVALPVATPQQNEEVVFYQEEPTAEEVVEMHLPEDKDELSFALPFLPGAPDEIVEICGDELEVDSKGKDEEKEKDKSKAADQPKDLNWVKDYLNKIPMHKGETIGLERAKSYLNRGLNFLSKMLQEDYDGKLDISKAEEARIEIENGIERLEKELQKRKKKASKDGEITKEAQKIPAVGGIIVTVPILISRIARVCINGSISGGRDIEDLFHRQAKKWNLTDREKAEVVQLISDMGYPVPRLDRGFMVDDKETYERSSTDNYDYSANYSA